MSAAIMSFASDDDVAFKVLNQDSLPITALSEAILKPFGRENQKQKPNGIVFPTRRFDLELNKNQDSNKSINDTQIKIPANHNLKRNYSVSNPNLDDTKFSKILDVKLKKLQKESKKNIVNGKRPRFVTTVKKGEFLEPPLEIAILKGLMPPDESKRNSKKLYAYASEPRVLNRTPSRNVHKMKCEAAAKAAALIMASVAGIDNESVPARNDSTNSTRKKLRDVPLPYQNMMFEKRVCRGSNFAPTTGSLANGESAAARAAEARRRALARRKAKNQQLRAAQLRLGSPPPVKGRKHEPVQTDEYLEEIFSNPPVATACTQTELFLERPISPFYVPAKTGKDQDTQIFPGDLFDFDMEVQPILEVLVGKTIEQALIEVLEEEELAALREQQRRFLEIRAVETAEGQRLEEREKRLAKEKERRVKEYEEGVRLQKEMEERIAASILMQGYLVDLLPSVLEGLENEGFLMDTIKEEIDEGFVPWLMKEVANELKDMVSSRDVLTDIVREILENRAEIYKALNQTPRSEPSEEEGPTQEDLILEDHMKLKQEVTTAYSSGNQNDQH